MRIASLSENLHAVEITARLLNDPPPPGYTYVLPVPGFGLSSLSGNKNEMDLFRGFLEKLVVEWMRCGKRIMPENAAVRASGMGSVKGYSTKTYWNLSLDSIFADDYGRIVRGTDRKEIDSNDPAYSSWLWKVYWDYLYRAKPNVWFNSDGEVLFNYTTPVYDQQEPFVELPPFLTADNPNLGCWMEAVLWFILLVNSGYAQLLDRCVFCQRFFVRKREKKIGQGYKRGGPNCGNCKGEVSKVRTSDIRNNAKERMLKVAAESWAAWKKSHRTPDRYLAVINRLNADCRDQILITTRKERVSSVWAKRNEKEIQKRVEALRNAKG
jgi:hypothetical protein